MCPCYSNKVVVIYLSIKPSCNFRHCVEPKLTQNISTDFVEIKKILVLQARIETKKGLTFFPKLSSFPISFAKRANSGGLVFNSGLEVRTSQSIFVNKANGKKVEELRLGSGKTEGVDNKYASQRKIFGYSVLIKFT